MAMAQNLRLKSNVDFVLSTTGIAGPGGGSEQKPVGTVWIGLSSKKETISTQYQFKGNRELLKLRFSQAGLFLLLKKIIEI
jgi:nicotinamide mononucleotide (NMN) deamidase PncC